MSQTIGMMDPAYFVGRKEIVEWINDTLQLNLAKVEQTASGAVACQLLDRMYPGAVPLHKVNWEAKQDYEFIANYKVLQSAFDKLKVDKAIDVPKLIKGKYQDNLEFMQWFKGFYELRGPGGNYDPVGRRAGGKGATRVGAGTSGSGVRATTSRAAPTRGPLQSSSKRPSSNRSENKENAGDAPARRSGDKKAATTTAPVGQAESKRGGEAPRADEATLKKLEEATQEVLQLHSMMEGLEKERDFYFEKLTAIEGLLQDQQAEEEQGEAPPSGSVA